ncbi:hypothetical protein [Nocardia harenae]|uniref:hypothetical protein n=1 Tax=Nocardia harenae TaxID=358707 RepID=UPI00082FF8D8|nr:hypothetical protein [Nocardia harenae]
MSPSKLGTRGRLLAAIVAILLIVVAALVPTVLDAVADDDEPAAAPPDLCAAIGVTVFERWVPAALPVPEATYSSGPDAACDYRSDPRSNTASGSLHVRLLAHGRFAWRSGADRASRALAAACEATTASGPLRETESLGRPACVAYQEDTAADIGSGSAVIRDGADLYWIDYVAGPGSIDRVREAIADVASAALSRVRR